MIVEEPDESLTECPRCDEVAYQTEGEINGILCPYCGFAYEENINSEYPETEGVGTGNAYILKVLTSKGYSNRDELQEAVDDARGNVELQEPSIDIRSKFEDFDVDDIMSLCVGYETTVKIAEMID